MAGADGGKEPEWIERLKSGGAVPLLDVDNCPNGWASPPGDNFMVRGPDYFSTKVKIRAGDYILKPLAFDWVKSSIKVDGILHNRNSRVRRVIDGEFRSGNKPFIWAFNIQVPSKDSYSAIAYFLATKPAPEGSLVDLFLKGDDAFRNSRLKLIANIVQGPWMVRKAVGEQAICVIGRALTCKYYLGGNFIEIDVDIGSSMVASAIVHVALGYITTLTVDLAFLIESQTESELPEKLLAAFRFSQLDPASAQSIEQLPDGCADGSPSSLSTRLWKSLGQGFSSLLNQGVQENGHDPANINGSVDHADDSQDLKKW